MALDVNGSVAVCPFNKERCSIRCAWLNKDTGNCCVADIASMLSPVADRAVVNE